MDFTEDPMEDTLDKDMKEKEGLEVRILNLSNQLVEAENRTNYYKAESERWERRCKEALVDCHKNNMARSSMLLAQETLARVTAEKNDIEGRLIRLEQECQEKVLKSEEYSRALNNELVNENVQLKERCTDLAEALDKEKSENLRWSQRIKFLDKRIRTSIEILEGKRVYDE